MKYSFMTFSCPQLSLADVLDLAKRTGYEGIEPRLVSNHGHGIETDIDSGTRAAIKQQVADSGIELACIATSCRYADPASTEQHVEDTHQTIDLAADVGATRIRVFGGQIGGGLSRVAATELVAKSLGSVADHAQERGVIVCMETHDAWCNPVDVANVMKLVDHSAIAVNWDIMHPVRTNHATIEESFETLRPWIQHLHIHDGEEGSSKLVPIGEGAIDHKTSVELLQSMSYAGYLSGEWINWDDPYENHLPREVATLRGYEK